MKTSKSNKSISYRSKSPHFSRNISPKKQLFPKNLSQNLGQDIMKYRKNIEQKLTKYIILFENGTPMKCFKHGNDVTLYHKKQRQPICIGCYNNKTRLLSIQQVIPLQKSLNHISNECQSMFDKIRQQLKALEQIEQTLYNGYQQEIMDFKMSFSEIQEVNHKCLDLINKIFIKKKQQITMFIQNQKIKHQSTVKQISLLKQLLIDYIGTSSIQFQSSKKQYQNRKDLTLHNLLYFSSGSKTNQQYKKKQNIKHKVFQYFILKQLSCNLNFRGENWKQKYRNKSSLKRQKVSQNLNKIIESLNKYLCKNQIQNLSPVKTLKLSKSYSKYMFT